MLQSHAFAMRLPIAVRLHGGLSRHVLTLGLDVGNRRVWVQILGRTTTLCAQHLAQPPAARIRVENAKLGVDVLVVADCARRQRQRNIHRIHVQHPATRVQRHAQNVVVPGPHARHSVSKEVSWLLVDRMGTHVHLRIALVVVRVILVRFAVHQR